MLRSLLFLGAVVSVVPSTMARAEEIPTAVLGLETSDCPQAVADEVADALRHGVSENRELRLVSGKDLVEVKLVFSCPDEGAACMAQAGETLGAKRLIYGSLKKSNGEVAVWLKSLDVTRASIESWVTDTVPKHTSASDPALRQAATRWLAKLTGHPAPGGTIKIAGGPVGAAVVVDGRDVGVLGTEPLVVKDVSSGEHEVALEGPGPRRSAQTISVNRGQTANISFTERAAAGLETKDAGGTRVATGAEAGHSAQEPSSRVSAYRMGFWLTLAGTLVGAGAALKYGLDVVKVNKDLDPYRRFPCTSATSWCDGQGRPAAPITDPSELDYIAGRNADGKHAQRMQWISIGAASLFGAATGVLFYLGYLDAPERPASGETYGLRLFPTLGLSSGGVAAELEF